MRKFILVHMVPDIRCSNICSVYQFAVSSQINHLLKMRRLFTDSLRTEGTSLSGARSITRREVWLAIKGKPKKSERKKENEKKTEWSQLIKITLTLRASLIRFCVRTRAWTKPPSGNGKDQETNARERKTKCLSAEVTDGNDSASATPSDARLVLGDRSSKKGSKVVRLSITRD